MVRSVTKSVVENVWKGLRQTVSARTTSEDFYRTQIIKYMWRLRDKGCPLKDAKKAQFYLERLIQKLS